MKTFILFVLVLVLSGCSSMERKESSSDNSCVSGNCINGYGTKSYEDNSRYTGNFSRGSRHGEGIYTWRDKIMIFGIWENDKLNGRCRKYEESGPWISGKCEHEGNKIVFSRNSTEQKREVSRQKAQNLLRSIQSM